MIRFADIATDQNQAVATAGRRAGRLDQENEPRLATPAPEPTATPARKGRKRS